MRLRNSDKLLDAIRSFEDALKYARSPEFQGLGIEFKSVLQSAVVQNFHLTFKVCLSMIENQLRDKLGDSAVKDASTEKIIRLADVSGVIGDVNRWLEYADCEHLSQSSTIAVRTFEKASDFLQDAKLLLTTCAKRTQNERRRRAAA